MSNLNIATVITPAPRKNFGKPLAAITPTVKSAACGSAGSGSRGPWFVLTDAVRRAFCVAVILAGGAACVVGAGSAAADAVGSVNVMGAARVAVRAAAAVRGASSVKAGRPAAAPAGVELMADAR